MDSETSWVKPCLVVMVTMIHIEIEYAWVATEETKKRL